ncbi:hypothetical protein [Streptomyces bambusae]|uniref:Secreted protein n=1 Tax=Streptomyces bambusae TaxID=1550616 RepID=A0ABS6YZX5_9ACTN|nr:hypothetical protein [Streptomyces bambusae]MBW5480573.1 hypothetical protein [Streptomyces bambusae]
MITASPWTGMPRTRAGAGPLRLLWLAALLFGFLYTHAAGADSASAHAVGAVVTAPRPTGESAATGHAYDRHDHHDQLPTGHGDGGGHSHPAETCDAGHPQQDIGLTPPGPGLHSVLPDAAESATALRADRDGDGRALPPLRGSVGSVVQQV